MVSHARGGSAIQTYFVQGSDGKFYGPADIPTLSHWATEGRILANTILVDQATNQQVAARDVAGLAHHFQLAPKPQSPQSQSGHTPYGTPAPNWKNPPQPAANSPRQYAPQPGPHGYFERKSKLVAALLAFFLGLLGIHRFYLGYHLIGVVMLGITIVGTMLCCFGFAVTLVWAIVDFVLILMNQLPDANGQSLD